jgi:hypothetical protein
MESPSDTLVTVPATVRMAAWEVGMLMNAVNATIRSEEMHVFKNDVFKRIVLTILPLAFL